MELGSGKSVESDTNVQQIAKIKIYVKKAKSFGQIFANESTLLSVSLLNYL